MQYIVLDLEWNQAMSARSPDHKRMPFRLTGEIIQIGAVKLNPDMTPGDEFHLYVKPEFYKKMHFRVKKLTGIDKNTLEDGVPFAEALEKFREFCGDDCTMLTWGYDDQAIMESNIIIHDLELDWIGAWMNLQVIYNMQVERDKNQKSLKTAMEHYGIISDRAAHDALGDAYNTALVCSFLDMEEGLAQYGSQTRREKPERDEGKKREREALIPLEHNKTSDYLMINEVLADPLINDFHCVYCSRPVETGKWVHQGSRRYMSLAQCPDHGTFLIRVKIKKVDDKSYCASRIVYEATKELQSFYNLKLSQIKRPNRGSKRKIKKDTATDKNT